MLISRPHSLLSDVNLISLFTENNPYLHGVDDGFPNSYAGQNTQQTASLIAYRNDWDVLPFSANFTVECTG